MQFAIDLAHDILNMQEEISELRHENAHLKEMVAMYQGSQQRELKQHQQTMGNILTALIDPDSGINRTARLVDKARRAGFTED